jgi:hypothetical protein
VCISHEEVKHSSYIAEGEDLLETSEERKLGITILLYLLCNLGFWGLAASNVESCFNVLVYKGCN